ncbi:hypothetical protein [Nocardia sp. CA-290969]|uniref:hypothetical protein n=1 Tax=Nocardia sp. CA-290969 TaxID=3239986 RepID=UPI003D9435AE
MSGFTALDHLGARPDQNAPMTATAAEDRAPQAFTNNRTEPPHLGHKARQRTGDPVPLGPATVLSGQRIPQ